MPATTVRNEFSDLLDACMCADRGPLVQALRRLRGAAPDDALRARIEDEIWEPTYLPYRRPRNPFVEVV